MRTAEPSWWRLPRGGAYLLAAAGALLALVLHHGLGEGTSDRSVFLLATVPVAVSAILWGLGPGLTASALGFAGSAVFFLPPVGFFVADPADRVTLAGYGLLWVMISMLGDTARRAVLRQTDDHDRALAGQLQIQSILSSITDGFFSVDLDWRITHANLAFERLANRPLSELIGLELWELYRDPSYYEARVKLTEAMRRQEPFARDLFDSKLNRWLHFRAYPNPTGMFVYVQDVTDQKELEQSRERMLTAERKARAEADGLNRMKDEFIATLSHELRSPLTTILGWTEILMQTGQRDPKVLEGLSAIERSATHQSRLIGDLLDMSRMAAGRLQLEREPLNLSDTAMEVVALMGPDAQRKRVALAAGGIADDAIVRGDAQRLFQVLANLVSNAIKFTPAGGKITVSTAVEDAFVVCRVEDTGEGLDSDFLPFLFDPFRQSDASSARRHGGLGLGLAIVRQLVELHGGQVAARSDGIGLGSCFEIKLPAVKIPAAVLTEVAPAERGAPNLHGLRVLVVDDEAEVRGVLRQMLTDAGADVETAEGGGAGLDALAAERYDVLLSDIGMPEMDGYQFLKLAKRRFGRRGEMPPAIALTAFVGEEHRDKSAKAGFARILTKPIDRGELLSAIWEAGASSPQEAGAK